MASLLNLKSRDDGKMVVEILIDDHEFQFISSDLRDLCLFSKKIVNTEANLILKGKNNATKYFLVPKTLRKNLEVIGKVTCQKMDMPESIAFIYIIEKPPPQKNAKFLKTQNKDFI